MNQKQLRSKIRQEMFQARLRILRRKLNEAIKSGAYMKSKVIANRIILLEEMTEK